MSTDPSIPNPNPNPEPIRYTRVSIEWAFPRVNPEPTVVTLQDGVDRYELRDDALLGPVMVFSYGGDHPKVDTVLLRHVAVYRIQHHTVTPRFVEPRITEATRMANAIRAGRQ